MDGNHGNIHPIASDFVDEGIPFIMANDIREGKIRFGTARMISRSQADSLQKGFALAGDILLTHKATLGETAIVPKIPWDYIMLTPQVTYYRVIDPKRYVTGFLYQYFSTYRFQTELENRAGGATRLYIGITEQRKLEIPECDVAEQRKIAEFLDTVDTKITQLAEKKRLLEDYKKGCLQHLFSQEIRFKDDDGNEFPIWEKKKLGEVFTWINTNSFSRELLTNEVGQVQNIHYGDIHTKFSANFHQDAELVPYVKDATPSDFKQEQFCKIGDVVIADASEDYADIGKAIEIVSLSDTPMVAGLHTYIARPKIATVQTGFSGYLLRSEAMRRQIVRIAQGISVLGISKGNLEKLSFLMPHPGEQRKIADFLSSIDRKIDLVSEELSQTQSFKKGLLQIMFV